MSAKLRMEVFPADLAKCIDFYTSVMRFTLLRQSESYAYLQRDAIFIGAVEWNSNNSELDELYNKKAAAGSWASVEGRQDKESNFAARKPPKGVEIVMEVDDIEGERDRIAKESGWELEADIKLQTWGLRDFRLRDPDGYYLRITEQSREGTKVLYDRK